MIIIDWLCKQRGILDFKLYPVSEDLYADDKFNLYKYLNYYDILVNLHCTNIDTALLIADNFTINIWHVVARMTYMDWEDLRIKKSDFFFNSLRQLHIREEYVSNDETEEKLIFEFKGKFYGEFEKFDTKKRSNLIYLGDEYRMAKLAYEEYLALKGGVKWKNEWNY